VNGCPISPQRTEDCLKIPANRLISRNLLPLVTIKRNEAVVVIRVCGA